MVPSLFCSAASSTSPPEVQAQPLLMGMTLAWELVFSFAFEPLNLGLWGSAFHSLVGWLQMRQAWWISLLITDIISLLLFLFFFFYSLQALPLQWKSINKLSRKLTARDNKDPFALKLFFFFLREQYPPHARVHCQVNRSPVCWGLPTAGTGSLSSCKKISFVTRIMSVNCTILKVRMDYFFKKKKGTNVTKKNKSLYLCPGTRIEFG